MKFYYCLKYPKIKDNFLNYSKYDGFFIDNQEEKMGVQTKFSHKDLINLGVDIVKLKTMYEEKLESEIDLF